MTSNERQVMLTILNTIKNMPYLWDKNNVNYSNQHTRDDSYNFLLEMYKTIDVKATKKSLKTRLENMRAAYYREYKKVTLSKIAATKPEDVYVSSLWYYDAYSFLKDAADAGTNRDDTEYFSSTEDEAHPSESAKTPKYKPQKKKFKEPKVALNGNNVSSVVEDERSKSESAFTTNRSLNNILKESNDTLVENQMKFLEKAEQLITSKEEDWEVIGRAIGVQLKDLDKRQLTIARKLISDVIYYASLDKLSEGSKVEAGPANETF